MHYVADCLEEGQEPRESRTGKRNYRTQNTAQRTWNRKKSLKNLGQERDIIEPGTGYQCQNSPLETGPGNRIQRAQKPETVNRALRTWNRKQRQENFEEEINRGQIT